MKVKKEIPSGSKTGCASRLARCSAFIVTNNLNKAYFLRENDPVFNGYVVKITGDSVTFQETIQDKLGKSFTREVVKRIITPAV